MARLTPITLVLLAVACGPPDHSTETERRTAPSAAARPAPGQEPLETESIGSDEVQTLPEERRAIPTENRVCSWSSAWQREDVPNPMLAGVGGVPMPTKLSDADILVPARDTEHAVEIIAEIVIGPNGDVIEATIVRAPDPRWPEAEDAILAAVRAWKYQPPTFDGMPISVCSTLVLSL